MLKKTMDCSIGMVNPVLFDLERARQEERRSKLSKAFSRLFKRHRKTATPACPAEMLQPEVSDATSDEWMDVPLCSASAINFPVVSLESAFKDLKLSATSGKRSSKKSSCTSSTFGSGRSSGGNFKGQLVELGRSVRRFFGLDSKRPRPIPETIPNDLGSPCLADDVSISMIPIEQKSEPAKLTQQGLAFAKLIPPTGWKDHQMAMAKGTYPLPGSLKSKYALTELLGEGSFGFVWVARHIETDTEVAVKFCQLDKVVQADYHWDVRWAQRVPKEVTILGSLDHPGIVRLLDYFEDASYAIIVTELFGTSWIWSNPMIHGLEGLRPAEQLRAVAKLPSNVVIKKRAPMDLFECIEAHTYLPECICRHIFTQLLDIVLYMKSQGVLHRDLKDENILVDETYRIKLVDFGSAGYIPRLADGSEDMFRTFNGTIAFSAPEIVRGLWYRGSAAEVWTMGIILYTLRFRRPPFPDPKAILESDPVGLEVEPGDSQSQRHLKALLQLMLQKRPGNRITLEAVQDHPWVTVCRA